MSDYDVIIIGAGGAGLMCASVAAARGRRVLVLDHAAKPGEKIRISGGGRCNFTNRHVSVDNFVSDNPRFCHSALAGFGPGDFIEMVENRQITYHERDHGQLFCDGSAQQITNMLLDDCRAEDVRLEMDCTVDAIERDGAGFTLQTGARVLHCAALVIATGGKSIPKMGASGFGYDIARQFNLNIVPTSPALVPFTFNDALREQFAALAGASLNARVHCGNTCFEEALLFTHRGLSGPAILQISSYWDEGDEIIIDLAPGTDIFEELRAARAAYAKQRLPGVLSHWLPKRLAQWIVEVTDFDAMSAHMADLSDMRLRAVARAVNEWRVMPGGTEGYRTAEATRGGVDTAELSSKTMECKAVPGLYFIGEVVDVTGHLGGFNFQWAWSSGYAAGQNV